MAGTVEQWSQNWIFVVMKLAMARTDADNANQMGFSDSPCKYAFPNEELRCSGWWQMVMVEAWY
ncbi:hypothetical protein PanWU01x14_185180 [Parasponia andersonii]|uniref:Uncharacterized protein n=1 Tax=Parasponia andersonii TaxID=3476 RepID=A0A2P5C415_PARAD|nr:hypothetical protein PanWU01x14_185180 [Parasponia andersonii]